MGGDDSAVSDTTVDILLESAFFQPLALAGKRVAMVYIPILHTVLNVAWTLTYNAKPLNAQHNWL